MKNGKKFLVMMAIAAILLASIFIPAMADDGVEDCQPMSITFCPCNGDVTVTVDPDALNTGDCIPRNELTSIMYPGTDLVAETQAREWLINEIKNGDLSVCFTGEKWDYSYNKERVLDRVVCGGEVFLEVTFKKGECPEYLDQVSFRIDNCAEDTWDQTVWGIWSCMQTTDDKVRPITPTESMERAKWPCNFMHTW